MANPIKILELKTQDWMKGLSIQSGLALGGLFSTAYNFDPFETMGYFQPSLAPVTFDETTITTVTNFLASGANSTDAYVFALGDRSGTGAKCLYRIKMADLTVADFSANLDLDHATGAVVHNGATVYKNRLVYASSTSNSIRAMTIAGDDDDEILASAGVNSTYSKVAFGLGSDGKLYYTYSTFPSFQIGKISVVTGTDAGNISNAFVMTDTALMPRDICNDGIYTIFIADTNLTKSTNISASCRIFFWDTIKSKADIIYDIPDSYLISARYVDGKVIILGSKGIWICNSATPPKLVFPLDSTKLPAWASQVTVQENIMYWSVPNSTGKIYAYGAKIGKPILFNPYVSVVAGNLHTALISSGSYFVASTDATSTDARIYLHNSGSTRAGAVAVTATLPLTQPYTLSFVKVTLKAPLSSGQSVGLTIYNGNGVALTDTVTKSYTANGAKQTLKFEFTLQSIKQFEDLSISLSSNGGAVVQRVSVYGVPTSDDSQTI